MIAGISGDLLSSAYLDTTFGAAPDAGASRADSWMRAVVRWWRRATQELGPATPPRALLDVGIRPLLELLNLRLGQPEQYSWGHAALLFHGVEPVATLVCTAWGVPPSSAWRHALRSTLGPALPWALLFTGPALAVFDATRPWSRRAVVFELEATSRDPRALMALRALVSGAALARGIEGDLGRAVSGSEETRLAVCGALGRGVLDALLALMGEIDAAKGPSRHSRLLADRLVFDQSLTIVYRLLFLLFAEARQLVPLWHRVYRDAYSMEMLCRRLIDQPAARGTWSAVQAMSRLAHAGCQAEDLRVTAFNGRLFAPGQTPLAEQAHVPDTAAARAVLALGTRVTRTGRQRIAFHDLGVEQLGAVYERVLEYEPIRAVRTLTLRATSTERKTTGSFYTPRAMTEFLVRRTLGPLVEGRRSDEILSLRVLDPAMGSGAFLVAACRYLTDRVEQARLAEGHWLDGEVTDADRAETARAIAERCLFGIDRNPTAVQLARLSLWLTTLAAERPLTFLDHHLAVGNSLVGARLADLSSPPAAATRFAGGRQLSLFDDDAQEAWGRAVVPERHRLALDPSDTPAQVRAKERRLDQLMRADGTAARWTRAADLWCGLALQRGRTSPGLYADLQQHVAGGPTALSARELEPRTEMALATARAHGAAHWEVLFPEVFLDAEGRRRDDAGFDAVIGNPPWEVLRADVGDDARRMEMRDQTAAMMRYVRVSGHYRLRASGHVNQYQLFLERAVDALRTSGRFGLILPSGIQSDVGSAALRRMLLDRCRVDTWIAFDNRRAIFPIHRSMRFVVLAGARGGTTSALPMTEAGGDVACLTRLPDDPRAADDIVPRVVATRAFIARWDPIHLTVPMLSAPSALAVAVKALDVPALGASNGWRVTFGRELNASDDRGHFVPRPASAGSSRLPVVEGKHLRPFGVELRGVMLSISTERARALLGDRWTYSRVCYRDVASAANRLTLIAAVLPSGAVSTHTVFCTRTRLDAADATCLMALLNSLVANYLVRLQMSTHVTTALMARLPVPKPSGGSEAYRTLIADARTLAARDSLEEAPESYARLNAVAARLYGLSAAEYRDVLATFPLLPEELRRRCLEASKSWD